MELPFELRISVGGAYFLCGGEGDRILVLAMLSLLIRYPRGDTE